MIQLQDNQDNNILTMVQKNNNVNYNDKSRNRYRHNEHSNKRNKHYNEERYNSYENKYRDDSNNNDDDDDDDGSYDNYYRYNKCKNKSISSENEKDFEINKLKYRLRSRPQFQSLGNPLKLSSKKLILIQLIQYLNDRKYRMARNHRISLKSRKRQSHEKYFKVYPHKVDWFLNSCIESSYAIFHTRYSRYNYKSSSYKKRVNK